LRLRLNYKKIALFVSIIWIVSVEELD